MRRRADDDGVSISVCYGCKGPSQQKREESLSLVDHRVEGGAIRTLG